MAQDLSKEEKTGLNDILLYVDGNGGEGGISVIFERNHAIEFAAGLFEAAKNLAPGQNSIALQLEGKMILKDKAILSDIDYSGKKEDADDNAKAKAN